MDPRIQIWIHPKMSWIHNTGLRISSTVGAEADLEGAATRLHVSLGADGEQRLGLAENRLQVLYTEGAVPHQPNIIHPSQAQSSQGSTGCFSLFILSYWHIQCFHSIEIFYAKSTSGVG